MAAAAGDRRPACDLERVGIGTIPPEFLAIVWQRFFVDRQRGVTMAAHFPWLFDRASRDVAWLARIDGAAAGMLVVRTAALIAAVQPVEVAAIGIVCTAPSSEGRGVASALLAAAIAAARDAGADAMLLWSRQGSFYRRFGFVTGDAAVFGSLIRAGSKASPPSTAIEFGGSPLAYAGVFGGYRGLPAFTSSLMVHASDDAVVVVAPGPRLIVIATDGFPDAAAALIGRLGTTIIELNDHGLCRVYQSLLNTGWKGALAAVDLAMWLPLTPACPPPATLAKIPISVLDRF